MKKFQTPAMFVQKLEAENVMSTSLTCFEINACVDCYCTKVTCDDVYECDSQKCPTLSDFD